MASAADLAAAFPGFAPLLAIPDVAAAISGLAPNANANEFIAAIMGTNWWKTTSQTERDWIGLGLSSPAEQTRQSNDQALKILEMASTEGIPMSLSQAHDLANQSLSQGWDASQLQYNVSALAVQGKDQAGTIGSTQTTLAGIAANQGVQVSTGTTFDWAKKIAMGTADQRGFEEYARQQAMQTHPYWSTQLQQGLTVRQLADPYIQRAAQTLEISPDQVDLTQPKWSFTQTDAKGAQAPMTQDQWQTKLMTDPQYAWGKTDNAQQAGYQIVNQLQQSFGAVK